MEEKKIATSVDILINVDRFEHLQITKYAEKKITYETQEEMIQKEDRLTNELVSDIRRSLKLSYESFSGVSKEIAQKMESVAKIEEKIGKKMPTWLEEGVEPNIANMAQKNANKAIEEAYAKNKDDKEKKEENKAETENFLEGKQEEPKEEPKKETKKETIDDDLFGDEEDLFK